MTVGWLISLAEPAPAPEQLNGLTWSRQQNRGEPAEQSA